MRTPSRTLDLREVIERYFQALAAGDEERWIGCFAADAGLFVPVGGPPIESTAELRALFRGLRRAFEALSIEPDKIWDAPDGAAVKWTARGTGHNGRSVTFEGVDVFEIDDEGRIRSLWSYWDPEELAAVLGT